MKADDSVRKERNYKQLRKKTLIPRQKNMWVINKNLT